MNDLNFDAFSGDGSAVASGAENSIKADFTIPDEYSQKNWSKAFEGKTGDELKTELFRSYDDLQNNLSLKVSDFLVSNDLKQLENYDEIKKSLVSQLMPEYDIPSDVNDYELGSVLSNEEGQKFFAPQEALELFGEKFKELGLSVKQGQELLKNYLDYEVREFQKYTDAEELEKNISGMFAQNPVQRSTVESLIREFLPPEDQKFLQDTMPNCVIEMFYKVSKGLVERYGYREGNAPSSPSAMKRTAAEKDEEYNRIASEIEALQHRPHTPEEKARLQAALLQVFED